MARGWPRYKHCFTMQTLTCRPTFSCKAEANVTAVCNCFLSDVYWAHGSAFWTRCHHNCITCVVADSQLLSIGERQLLLRQRSLKEQFAGGLYGAQMEWLVVFAPHKRESLALRLRIPSSACLEMVDLQPVRKLPMSPPVLVMTQNQRSHLF